MNQRKLSSPHISNIQYSVTGILDTYSQRKRTCIAVSVPSHCSKCKIQLSPSAWHESSELLALFSELLASPFQSSFSGKCSLFASESFSQTVSCLYKFKSLKASFFAFVLSPFKSKLAYFHQYISLGEFPVGLTRVFLHCIKAKPTNLTKVRPSAFWAYL